MNITAQLLDKARAGFKSLYNTGFDKAVATYDQLAMVINSNSSDETYGWLKDTSVFRQWLGDRVIQNLSESGFSIKNKSFENTVSVKKDAIEDDKLGLYSVVFTQLGVSAKRHPDSLLFPLIVAGFASVCYDGQYFFDTDHPVVDENGVTQSVSNSGGGSSAAWCLLDTSQPIKPFIFQKRQDYNFVYLDKDTDGPVFNRKEYVYGVDCRCNVGYGLWQLAYGSKQTLDVTNFNAGYTALISMKGDGGKPLGVMPDVLLVGPSNLAAAEALVKAQKLANGADNTNYNKVKIVLSPYLT